jgi:hypothetical protein
MDSPSRLWSRIEYCHVSTGSWLDTATSSCYATLMSMRFFENETFRRFYDRDSGAVFSDLEFHKCHFQSGAISIALDPKLRSTVRNIKAINCQVTSGSIQCAVVEDVTVDGLKTNRLFQTWAAVFKHVVLKGKIGRVMFSPAAAPGVANQDQQQAFDDANAAFYQRVDWALDISEAQFEECDIRNVPANLIRRDPETQVVVTRAKAAQGEWRKLDLSKTYWPVFLNGFLNDGDRDIILVAPKRSKRFPALLDGLKMLRDAGVAEPD